MQRTWNGHDQQSRFSPPAGGHNFEPTGENS